MTKPAGAPATPLVPRVSNEAATIQGVPMSALTPGTGAAVPPSDPPSGHPPSGPPRANHEGSLRGGRRLPRTDSTSPDGTPLRSQFKPLAPPTLAHPSPPPVTTPSLPTPAAQPMTHPTPPAFPSVSAAPTLPTPPALPPAPQPVAQPAVHTAPRSVVQPVAQPVAQPPALPPTSMTTPPKRVPNAFPTMLGVSAEELNQLAELRAAGAAAQAQAQPQAPAPAMAPTPAAPEPLAAPEPPVAPPVAAPPKLPPASGTLQGTAPPTPAPPPAGPVMVPTVHRTMQGVMVDTGAPPPPSSAAVTTPSMPPQNSAAASAARARREAPPMMGGHSPGVPPDTVPPGDVYLPKNGLGSGNSRDDGLATQDYDIPGMPRKGRSAARFVPIVAGVFVLVGLVAAAGWWATHRTPTVSVLPAQVRSAPTGNDLVVSLTVPNARAGTKLKYNGQEFAIDPQGRAEFPVSLAPTQVGVIDLPAELVTSSGAEARTVRFTIAWRVEPDLRHLGEDPPSVHLVFHVPTGASLSVVNQAIQVSGGTGIAALPAPTPAAVRAGDTDATRRDRYPIRVTLADGTRVEGEYELRLPRTALRIDAPPPVSAINAEEAIVQGTVGPSARVRVGAVNATVTGTTFTANVPLREGRNDLNVDVFAPGGAPARAPLVIYRNVAPDAYLAMSGGNRGPAALAANPPAVGARLRVNAQVIGTINAAGPEGPTFQVVVTDRACPNNRCPAWVNVGPNVGVSDRDNVEIVGEITGARAYATQSGERRSDPVIQAFSVTARR